MARQVPSPNAASAPGGGTGNVCLKSSRGDSPKGRGKGKDKGNTEQQGFWPLRLAGGSGPREGTRLALVATNQGNGQLGQDKSPNSQFDNSAEFFGRHIVGLLWEVGKGCIKTGALLG